MNSGVMTFEARVLVSSGQEEYKPICYYGKGEWARKKIIKMFHIDARTHKQAMKLAKRYGTLLSCRKVQIDEIANSIEKLDISQLGVYGGDTPYKSAMAMDEMIWQKQKRRK